MWAASGGVGDRQEAMTYGQRVETVMLDCLLVIQKLYKHATIAERQQEQSMFWIILLDIFIIILNIWSIFLS